MVLDACSQTKQSAASAWLDQVVQDLNQDQELVRIKKLLIYTCTQIWESDPEQIQAADLQNLLQMLLIIAPTPEKMRFVLHNVAGSLNKAAEYTLIANAILDPLKQRYPDSVQADAIDSDPADYRTIAAKLHRDPEAFRIRKLLLFACKNIWISDRQQLVQSNLESLVQELHNLASSPESLHLILENRIQKLNKSAVYELILDKIFQALQPLYQVQLPSEYSGDLEPESTQLLSQLLDRSPQQVEGNISLRGRSNSVLPATRTQLDLTNLFDLRLEIIRYTNPFRTKILLFSLLHEPFSQTPEHHLLLKNYELDDLLRTVLKTYKSFEELAMNLSSVAKQLDEPEEYDRMAQVVLRASKIFYAQMSIAQMPIASASQDADEQATNLVKTINSSGELTGPEPF